MIKNMELAPYLITGINIQETLLMINIMEMALYVEKMEKYMNVNLKMGNQMDWEESH